MAGSGVLAFSNNTDEIYLGALHLMQMSFARRVGHRLLSPRLAPSQKVDAALMAMSASARRASAQIARRSAECAALDARSSPLTHFPVDYAKRIITKYGIIYRAHADFANEKVNYARLRRVCTSPPTCSYSILKIYVQFLKLYTRSGCAR